MLGDKKWRQQTLTRGSCETTIPPYAASVTSPPCRRQLNASLESGSPLLSPLVGGSDGGIGSYELELQVSELKEELEKIKGEKNALQEEFDNLAFAAEDIKTRYEETKILKENYRLVREAIGPPLCRRGKRTLSLWGAPYCGKR